MTTSPPPSARPSTVNGPVTVNVRRDSGDPSSLITVHLVQTDDVGTPDNPLPFYDVLIGDGDGERLGQIRTGRRASGHFWQRPAGGGGPLTVDWSAERAADLPADVFGCRRNAGLRSRAEALRYLVAALDDRARQGGASAEGGERAA